MTRVGATLAGLVGAGIFFLAETSSYAIETADASVEKILSVMAERRPSVEALLKDNKVGEGLDGRLRVLACDENEEAIVAAENRDRLALFRATAKRDGVTAREAGRKASVDFVTQLKEGMMRQVSVAGVPVWWDGLAPNPEKESESAGAMADEGPPETTRNLGDLEVENRQLRAELVSARNELATLQAKISSTGGSTGVPPVAMTESAQVAAKNEEIASLKDELERAIKWARRSDKMRAEAHLRLASANANLAYNTSQKIVAALKAGVNGTNPHLKQRREDLGRLASDYRSHIIDLAEIKPDLVSQADADLRNWFKKRPELSQQVLTLEPIKAHVAAFRLGKGKESVVLINEVIRDMEDSL